MKKKKTGIEWLLWPYYNLGINEQISCRNVGQLELYNSLLVDFYNRFIKNHPEALEKDVLWAYFNFLLNELVSRENNVFKLNSKLSAVYCVMYRFRFKYDKIVDKRLLQLNLDYQIKSIDPPSSGFEMEVVIFSVKGCCEYCDSFSNKTFEYSYSQNNSIVDVSKCIKKGLSPLWTCAIRPKRDSKSDLIEMCGFTNDKLKHKSIKRKVVKKRSGCFKFLLMFIAVNFILMLISFLYSYLKG